MQIPAALLILMVSEQGFGQNNTSPYSMLGIGNIRNEYFDYSSGMAGAAISLRSAQYILEANPASLGYLANHYFAMEVGTGFQSTKYSGDPLNGASVRSSQAQVQRFAMATKLTSFWGASVGLKQFSSSNYSLYGLKNILGTADYLNTFYEGSGGINQVYFSNGLRLGKNLSIGVNSSFLFGSMTQDETLNAQNYIGSQLNTSLQTYYSGFYFEGGLQYSAKLSNKLVLSMGAVAAHKTTLNGTKLLSLSSGDPNTAPATNIISDSTIGTSSFNLPNMIGGGVSVEYNRSLTFSADYRYQPWSQVNNNNGGNNYTYSNSSEFSFGLQYAPKKVIAYHEQLVEFQHYFMQAGTFLNNEYITIRGQQIKDAGLSLGFGVNSLRSSLSYLFSFQYGNRGTTLNNLIQENYYKVGITISYRDLWKKQRMQ